MNLIEKTNFVKGMSDNIRVDKELTDNVAKICVSRDFFSNREDDVEIFIVTKTPLSTKMKCDLEVKYSEKCSPFIANFISETEFTNSHSDRDSQIVWEH